MLLNRPRADAVMDRHGLDGLLAATRQNIYYLTDHWGYTMRVERQFINFAVLPRDAAAPAGLVIGMTESGRLAAQPTWVPNVIGVTGRVSPTAANVAGEDREAALDPMSVYLRRDDAPLTANEQLWIDTALARRGRLVHAPAEGLKRLIVDAGLAGGRLGVDDPRLIGWLHAMGLEEVRGVDATNVFREIRMVKSADEIALLRQAGEINEAAMQKAVAAIREGASADELERVYMVEMARRGGQGLYILFGTVSGLRHGAVRRDEPLLVDALGAFAHYHGDIGRTVVLGEPDAETRTRDRAMQAGWAVACETIRPGVRGSDVVRQVMDIVHREGFPRFNHAVAHTVGLEHTDHPLPIGPDGLGADRDFVIEEDMVLNFDMPFQEYGWGSMHIEDTMRVTRDGVEPLTSFRTALQVL